MPVTVGMKRPRESVRRIAFTPPAEPGSFAAAFVLPVARDGRVLLTREQRGKEAKLGLLGGKTKPGEDSFATAAREAREESGGGRGSGLSKVTLARMARGAGVLAGSAVRYEQSKCVAIAHDLVVPVDLDVHMRFPKSSFRTDPKSKALQMGLEWVAIGQLCDAKWRKENLYFIADVLCARLAPSLSEYSV